MLKRQPYRKLSFVRAAMEYANSPACNEAGKKHIEVMVAQAEMYRDGMHRWQDMVIKARNALTPNLK